jgi:GTP diphosphokinase / guanosine-3',5'-bis(diphosphate) 3'-diphosphatase
MSNIQRAIEFAVKSHAGQFRKGTEEEPWKKIPYVSHCFEVMKAVSEFGIDDEAMLIAALLHDVIEDCEVTVETIKGQFGVEVAKYVLECTREGGDDVSKLQKYEFLESFSGKSLESISIKIADRCCNVQDYLSTEGKEDYAAQYALQAHPLVRAYLDRCDELEEVHIKRINKAVCWLVGVVEKKYGVNFTEPDISKWVKGKVI